ncbi:hypothetical protein C8A05DRAFT_12260 [Staphylotrichum tortipilum]|uniref:DUF221-domain-containing protein n=1 Tax=Staphylotrichum tortipilum TaxID=2831512 RepID=A0AAN6MRV8_9PEZI|nr:hypothetical protein C8A05DRAFT_12260 [Staphylotrichum longicolle]
MDWTVAHLARIDKRLLGINESSDSRVGSSRNDSSGGGTVSHYGFEPEKKKDSASLSSLGSTLIPVLIYSGICFLIFLVLRRKFRRVYSPRTLPCLRTPFAPTPELPDGWFNWIKPFFAITDEYILNNCSLDGFFFLRFLRILTVICLVGTCIVWPILLPVNSTGKSGLLELESLTIGNIAFANKFYAHVVAAWCFFGFVLYMVCRECVYYVNLRQAYLLSPNYSQRLSSRTVLFTCIPKPYMDESKLRKLFGDSAKNIWIVRDTSALRALVEDREADADRLQQAEVTLIRSANLARQKYLRKNLPSTAAPQGEYPHLAGSLPSDGASQDDAEKGQTTDTTTHSHVPEAQPTSQPEFELQLGGLHSPTTEKPADPEYTHPYGLHPTLPDVRGSVAALWIPVQSRPHHRPLRNFGRRVDTIRWTRARLKVLNKEIWKLRRRHRGGDGAPLNAAFIEFDSQANAQSAFQILAHHQPLHMSPRYIGIPPDEVIWSALRIRWWEHIMRRFFMMGVIAAAIIFWSIPAVGVGVISNVESLSEKVFFLSWLMALPKIILGVIQGLLPALALTWLMAAVPWMLRGCARVAGVPSHALVELFVQHAYFAFQVVQVFLVTTLTSAASAAIIDVLKDPLTVKDVLSENLPKASNFYLSYILIQCLGAGAAMLANVGDLFRHEVISRAIPNPRRKFYRWSKLTVIHWGSEFPRFTNLGVIAISYSCIAPLILVFAGLGMFFISYVYRYCLLYVYDSGLDTKGLFYPRALMQLLIGLYIAEVCLIGLFALKSAIGPLLLMAIFLVFTGLVHISLDEAVTPLLNNIPRTLALEKDIGRIAEDERPGDETSRPPDGGLAADYYNLTDDDDDDDASTYPDEGPTHDLDTDIQLRGIEGTGTIKYHVTEWTKSLFKSTLKKATLKPTPSTASQPESSLTRILTQIKIFITPDPSRKPNFFLTFLHPEIYQDFRTLQPTVNPQPEHVALPPDYAKRAYWPPEMWAPAPRLWIPRDEARVSRQEVAHSSGVLGVSDKGCWLVENGGGDGEGGKKRWGRRRKPRRGRGVRVECEFEESPLFEERVLY